MRQGLLALVALPVSGALLLGAGGPAKNGAGSFHCTTQLLKGGYTLSGAGEYAQHSYQAIQTLEFDGAGKMSGKGTAVLDKPASVVVPCENQDGTYSLHDDCRGTMRWFGHHPTIPVADHFHNADFVVSDGGKQISLIYTNSEFPNGLPEPIESLLMSGTGMRP